MLLRPLRWFFAAGLNVAAACANGQNFVQEQGSVSKPASTGPATSAPATTAPANRLHQATSPYLLQHAHNPVNWYEWGPEAFERAKRKDKPIFLSIGYAACHWCHVMAHESFEDPDVAAVMNEHFVNIKVDREERPDVDEIYMRATLALNQGQGGWPMSVWLTPDRKPFFAGTYFPPRNAYGRPGFKELCESIGRAWKLHRNDIDAQAEKLTGLVREGLAVSAGRREELTADLVDRAAEMLARHFDAVSGGMSGGGTNKFPPSMALDVMLRSAVRRPSRDAVRKKLLELVEVTLDHMAAGGIYDQLGGGFHRYSTDVEWHVPHFEKMLYDQALVSRSYVDAWQVTRKPLYARIVREVFDYVLADLQSPQGGFYSTRDADSEGIEGKYYVWTRDEVRKIAGQEDGETFCAHYDVRESGNWRDPHDPNTTKNVLRVLRDPECCARMLQISLEEFHTRLGRAREKLLAARAKRVAPGRDEKVLCEWTGLMIASLARGGCVLGEQKYTDAAARAADFIFRHQCRNGRLLRSYRDGRTLGVAFLSDYANMIEGCLELYEATFERRWIDRALELNATVLKHFWDERDGGCFFTPDDHEELLTRGKDARDGAVPSGNAVQVMNLLRLSDMLGDTKLREQADQTLAALAGPVQQAPWSTERMLCAVDFAAAGAVEVAIVGDPQSEGIRALLREVYDRYIPNRVLMLHNPKQPQASVPSPLLQDRTAMDGQPTAYVCRQYVCKLPAKTPQELARQLSLPGE